MKMSKIFLLSLTIGAVLGGSLFADANAAPTRQPTYTVRDMMLRKGRIQPPPAVKHPNVTAPAVVTAPVVSNSPVVSNVPVQAKAPVVASKDGSLFGGKPCVNCGPVDKDGSLFPGGDCDNCHNSGPLIDTGPCDTCTDNMLPYTPIYTAVARQCCSMAPLYLDHVDFNLSGSSYSTPYEDKLGHYRFRIFGCRRFDKEAVLNQGRIMEKDMNFSKIFEDVTGDCYNLVKMPQDICLQTTPSPLPEYILTAEITDFFMNVCDGYDWNNAQGSKARSGSAEISVTWRLSNLTKTEVLWEGSTTGYSDLPQGVEKGEIALIEQAFADAVSNLRILPGFEEQLMIRLTPEELTAQRNALIDEEIALDPAKCRFNTELNAVKQCEVSRPEVNFMQCPAIVEQTGVVSGYEIFDNYIAESSNVVSDGNFVVVDDTWVDMQNDVKSFDSLCIIDRKPYDVLSPENLYKVRASVVEINNAAGKKGAGLIISETFVLTSADLVEKDHNMYQMKTINNQMLSGRAVRINPSKNTALIMLDQPTEYTPLSLNLDLPKVGQGGFMTLGVLDVDNFADGENYIDNNGKVTGYRYSEDKGSEIMIDTFVQNVTIGGVLIDGHGTINGIAHSGQKTEKGMDLFLPTETALRSIGLSICEKLYEKSSPWQQTVYKPVTEIIMTSAPKAPEVMKVKDRK